MPRAESVAIDGLRLVELDPTQEERLEEVLELGTHAFSELGEYRQTLGYWIARDGVQTTIALHHGLVVGFVTFAYRRDVRDQPVGEIIAIAVCDQLKRHGVGRALMNHAVPLLIEHADAVRATYLRLAVADGNQAGQALFESFGFRGLRTNGAYPGGQRSMEMTRNLTQ